MKLSLVVPCYNEEDNVRAFYEAVHTAISYPDAPEDLLLCDMDAPDLESAVWEAVPLETETTEETLPATE